MKIAAVAIVAMGMVNVAKAGIVNQHSVEGLVAALNAPLSAQTLEKARAFDDALLSEGRNGEQRVYLVTDQRSQKVNDIAFKLLAGLNEDPQKWLVRVLDSTPPDDNAFVVGGRYVYVFTDLLRKAESDDEIAFVLGHELGHSLLKQGERLQNDLGMQLANLIALLGSTNNGRSGEGFLAAAKSMHAQYSQQDEAEADAIGAAIAYRAGFDPLRGIDFFTRAVRASDSANPGAAMSQAQIDAMRAEVVQLQSVCVQWMNAWNAGKMARTQENSAKLNGLCAGAEEKRVAFNQRHQEFYSAQMQRVFAKSAGTHPDNQSRVAALAATIDVLAGRREVSSLEKYATASQVMQALTIIDSPLMHPRDRTEAQKPQALESVAHRGESNDLTQRLLALKAAFDAGLITREEYDAKRQQLLQEL